MASDLAYVDRKSTLRSEGGSRFRTPVADAFDWLIAARAAFAKNSDRSRRTCSRAMSTSIVLLSALSYAYRRTWIPLFFVPRRRRVVAVDAACSMTMSMAASIV